MPQAVPRSHHAPELLCPLYEPIGVATYRIVSTLPRELEGQLPAPEQIAKLLEGE
jgi:hypothetical protein